MSVNLREERLNKGKTLLEAAEEIGVGWTSLLRAEKHGTRPRPSNALKIALYYGKRPSDIWPLNGSES